MTGFSSGWIASTILMGKLQRLPSDPLLLLLLLWAHLLLSDLELSDLLLSDLLLSDLLLSDLLLSDLLLSDFELADLLCRDAAETECSDRLMAVLRECTLWLNLEMLWLKAAVEAAEVVEAGAPGAETCD